MALKDNYFSVSQAAKKLGVTRQTIHRWIADGELSAEKVGRETLIEKRAIRQYEQKQFSIVVHKMAIDYLREKYHYSEDDKVETRGLEKHGDWTFSVTKRDGTREKLRIGKIEVVLDMNLKLLNLTLSKVIRTKYKQSGKEKNRIK